MESGEDGRYLARRENGCGGMISPWAANSGGGNGRAVVVLQRSLTHGRRACPVLWNPRETNEQEPSGTTVNRAEGGGPTCRHAIADCAEELDRLFTIEGQKLFWMLRVEMQPIRPMGRP
jgi:hypothetical protein